MAVLRGRINALIVGLLALTAFVALSAVRFVSAEQLIPLRNGLTLRGNVIQVATLDQNSFVAGADGGIQIRPIWMVDDGLSRTYIHRRGMVSAEPVQVPDILQRIEFFQPVPEGAPEVGNLGLILNQSSFDSFGRRQMMIRDTDGRGVVIHQGITELNSRYAKVESLIGEKTIQLDMRLSTKLLDTPTLQRVFQRRIPQDDVDRRLDVVRFFQESERYGDAHAELRRVIKDFPSEAAQSAQLPALVELQALQLLEQAELRRQSGQPRLAEAILDEFPLALVGRVTAGRVEKATSELDDIRLQCNQLSKQLRDLINQLQPDQITPLQPLADEIEHHLSAATLPRLSDFARLGGNPAVPIENRVALAVAGWLLGSGSGEQNLKIATALIEVRRAVRAYLRESDPGLRRIKFDELNRLEVSRAETIARMLPLMRPVWDQTSNDRPLPKQPIAPESATPHDEIAGLFRIDERAVQPNQTGDPQGLSYLVQLPPEYDPRRAYPCVVALHAARAEPATQLNWWAGVPTDQFLDPTLPGPTLSDPTSSGPDESGDAAPSASRLGHAMRHGFIVVAPAWTRPGQRDYEYTSREHAAVLRCTRSAMRRFSIDADRIFLAGHGAGGTAAWDIVLSHPDLWAGVVPINADPKQTILHYNAVSDVVPIYLLMGEKDGRPLKRYGAIYDQYMSYNHDAMVVLMRGRGREFFTEQTEKILLWMKSSAHVRPKPPENLQAGTMRDGDQFFWWLEWEQMLPGVSIDPILFASADRIKDAKVESKITANNGVLIQQAPSKQFTVWLGPHLPLKMNEPIEVQYRSRRKDFVFNGELETMLEDVRTRADRVRPFWGKVIIP
ncbi:MAG: alpha/beta hydrolase [Planctomycetota bacterium]